VRPESIREALDLGHAERVGHGIRILDDAELVDEVRRRQIPLEVCPSSNVALGLVGTLDDHPLPRLLQAGLRVTLNADVRRDIGTWLGQEYARVRRAFAFDDQVMADLARAGIEASFAPQATKARLLDEIAAWLVTQSEPSRRKMTS